MFEHLFDETEERIINMGLYPICAGMCHALAIPEIIDREIGVRDPRFKLTVGQLVTAMIIDILHGRHPIYKVAEAFENVDCGVLFEEGVVAGDFTQDRLGTALDEIGELNHRTITAEIAIRALALHGVPVESTHIDGTNISLCGDYTEGTEEPAAKEAFEITYGKAKDNSTGKKLVGLGGTVQQDGLPLFAEVLSGNSSDAVWFRTAMDEMARLYAGNRIDNPILIYDAAASNEETFDKSWNTHLPCIIRLSERFNTTGEHIMKAWEEDDWKQIGVIANAKNSKSANYRLRDYEVKLGEHPWRLFVIHSSALQSAKEKTAKRHLPKAKELLTKAADKLAKKSYDTPEKAREAANKLLDSRTQYKQMIDCTVDIETKITSKYAKKGRPGKDAKKILQTTYHAKVIVGDKNDDLYQEWLKRESCFVLVSNVPDQRYTATQILKEYNNQWKIESLFRFLKQPVVLGPLWLQKPKRIKGLILVLWLAVLVAAYIRHRLFESMQSDTALTEDELNNTLNLHLPETDGQEDIDILTNRQSHFDGKSRPVRIRTDYGRLVENPSFKIISELFSRLQIKVRRESGRWTRKFLHQTKHRLLVLCVYMGFHPQIYLEPFRPMHDLWNYRPLNHGKLHNQDQK